jgi:hypothetical protein
MGHHLYMYVPQPPTAKNAMADPMTSFCAATRDKVVGAFYGDGLLTPFAMVI